MQMKTNKDHLHGTFSSFKGVLLIIFHGNRIPFLCCLLNLKAIVIWLPLCACVIYHEGDFLFDFSCAGCTVYCSYLCRQYSSYIFLSKVYVTGLIIYIHSAHNHKKCTRYEIFSSPSTDEKFKTTIQKKCSQNSLQQ